MVSDQVAINVIEMRAPSSLLLIRKMAITSL